MDKHRNKPWFDRECSELAIKRKWENKETSIWVQNSNDQTAEDFTNIRPDTFRTFKKKEHDYKAKVNRPEKVSKNKNIL